MKRIAALTSLVFLLLTIALPGYAQYGTEIFDDFDYSSNSQLFGSTSWCSTPSCTTTKTLRSWYFFNWDGAFSQHRDSHVAVEVNPWPGRTMLKITMDSNFRDPAIVSGFTFKTGTWFARVKFDNLPSPNAQDNLQQAYWLTSPIAWKKEGEEKVRTTELDFEWNNWFGPATSLGYSVIDVTNHGWDGSGNKQTDGATVDCVYFKSGNGPTDFCNGYITGQYRIPSSLLQPGETQKAPGDEWWDMMIVNNGNQIKYSMENDGYGNVSGSVWGGNTGSGTTYGNPIIRSDYRPQRPAEQLAVAFSQHFRTEDDNPDRPYAMWVEFFYYSSATNLSFEQVQQRAYSLQQTLQENQGGAAPARYTNTTYPTRSSLLNSFTATIGAASNVVLSGQPIRLFAEPSLGSLVYKFQWWERTFYNSTGWGNWQQLSGRNLPWLDVSTSDTYCASPYKEYRVDVTAEYTTRVYSSVIRIFNGHCTSGWSLGDEFETDSLVVSIHPNPFNPTTQIDFKLPDAADVSLIIYDILGREIVRLANGWHEAGDYSTSWDASNFPTGVYFLKIEAGSSILIQRMVLVK